MTDDRCPEAGSGQPEARSRQPKAGSADARGLRLFHELWQDLRYAARMLRKHAALTTVVTITLAVGIGANTTLFSVVNSVLLKPLPFADANRLVVISEQTQSRPDRGVAYPDFLDWQARQTTFDSLAASMVVGGVLTGGGDPERVFGRAVSREFFPTLGAAFEIGRTFTRDEDQPGGERAMILGFGLWQRRYGADPGIAGRTVNYNGAAYTVVGVLRRDFDFYGQSNANNDFFVPLGHLRTESYMQKRDNYPVRVIARVKGGVPLRRANDDVSTIAAALAVEHAETNRGVGASLRPLLEDYVGDVRLPLAVLLGASVLVLTIACVNVANLLLARAASRRQEIALRLALGARRGRIVRQLLTESLLLSTLGGAAGLFLAWSASGWVARLAPETFPRIEEVGLDWSVVAFAMTTTMITGLMFGLVPAVQSAEMKLEQVLRSASRGIAGGGRRLRETLVVAQIALCVALLIATGLLLRSFQRLSGVDPGFRPHHVVTMRLRLPDARYRTRTQVLPVLDGLLGRVAGVPGIESACLTTGVPLGRTNEAPFAVAGQEPPLGVDRPVAVAQWVSAGCHETFGIGLIAGRYFAPADREERAAVAIVDEEFVRQVFSSGNPAGVLGQRVRLIEEGDRWREIVGVVRHIRHTGLDERPRPQVYAPYLQMEPGWQLEIGRAMDIAIRSSAPATAVVASVRKEIQHFDPELPLSHVVTLDDAVSRSVAPRLFNLVLLGLFGAAALVLCGVGIYGVVSYSVAQQTREIGVRVTLGAQRAQVLRLVVGRGMQMVLAGVGAGAVAALLLGRTLEGLLFGVPPRDPLTFVAVAGLLTAIAAVAAYLPARRVLTLDLVSVLRAD